MTNYRTSRSFVAITTVMLSVLGTGEVSAQDKGQSFSANANLVLVPVTVADHRYQPMIGLSRENFRIYQDGRLQSITSFGTEDSPASIVLVFDQSRSMKSKLRDARTAAIAILNNANTEDETALVTLAAQPRLDMPFTSNTNDIARALPATTGASTALLDALDLAFDVAHTAQHSKRAMIVLSDGGENHSRHTFTELQSRALETNVQVYALAVPADHREESKSDYILGRLCAMTGGLYIVLQNSRKLPEIAAQIGRLIRDQYLIGYRPDGKTTSGKWADITVKVDKPGSGRLHVTARRGFRAP